MMKYELNDLSFFIKSLKHPTQSFNIHDYNYKYVIDPNLLSVLIIVFISLS